MDFSAILEISKAWGPTVILACLAFYFMDKKDTRNAATIKSVVEAHREDFTGLQDRTEKHVSALAQGHKEDLDRVLDAGEKHNERLYEGMRDIRSESRCKLRNAGNNAQG